MQLSVLYRRIKKQGKVYAISIIGLSLSLAVSFLLLAYVQHQSTYDQYNTHISDLYILKQKYILSESSDYTTPQTPPAFADFIKDNYPEIDEVCLLIETWGAYIESDQSDQFYEAEGFYADQSVFSLFTYEFLEGNPTIALNQPESVVLSESMSKKLFPKGNAMGSMVTVSKCHHLTVTGVYKDLPHNMHIRPSYLCTFHLYEKEVQKDYRTSVRNQAFKTYALVRNEASLTNLNHKVNQIYTSFDVNAKYKPFFSLVSQERDPGNSNLIYIASAVLLLLLSAFNYINTATIGFINQVKEFGIRQVLGAKSTDLIIMLLKEVCVLGFIISSLSLIIVNSLLPHFNELIGSVLELHFPLYWQLILYVTVFLLLTLAVGIVFPIIKVLSNTSSIALIEETKKINRSSVSQLALLVLQFGICVCFLIFSFGMQKQMQHITNKDMGLNPEGIIYSSPVYNGNNANWKALLVESLKKDPNVENVSFSMSIPFYGNSGEVIYQQNGLDKIGASRNWINADYFDTFGIEFLHGRNFSEFAASGTNKCIITEKTAKLLGLKNPVGQWIKTGRNKENYQVIGVVKNHEHHNISSESPPMIFYNAAQNPLWTNKIAIALKKFNSTTKAEIKDITSNLLPDLSFEYHNYDETVEKYRGTYNLKNSNRLFNYFTLIALVVSLLGLYNIVATNTKARTKEIGIRKTNGAKTTEIITMLNVDVLKWIMVAFIIACPIAFYTLSEWLNNFVYKTDLSWWLFALVGLLMIAIAVITITWQSWHTANQNPVKALRYE